MKNNKFIIFALVLLCCSCGNKELSREVAKNKIMEISNFPDQQTYNVKAKLGLVLHSQYKELQAAGLINIETKQDIRGYNMQNHDPKNLKPIYGMQYYVVTLTEEGQKYFIEMTHKYDGEFYQVKTFSWNFAEITGVQKLTDNLAKVDYKIEAIEITPFGKILAPQETTNTEERHVQFQLYDDGWRISQ